MDKGTSLILIPQAGCPAVLVAAEHSPSDFLQSAVLRNNSDGLLVGFRLGWVVCFPSREPEVHLNYPISLPEPIKAGGTWTIPAQGIRLSKESDVRAMMGFFVAEAFLGGSKSWRADLEEIKKQASGAF